MGIFEAWYVLVDNWRIAAVLYLLTMAGAFATFVAVVAVGLRNISNALNWR